MTMPITVTFPKTKASPWLEAEIRERVERLKVVFADILSCRVVVDIPHRHHQRGNRFALRIEIGVPGLDLAITRDANLHAVVKDLDEASWSKRFDVEATRRDIRVVLADAFDAAKRRLRDYAQLRRREVKRHGPPRRVALAEAPRRARVAAAR
ncbi:MAG: HPF/RaiA family ribosome-associated protein [Vicinamibacterales bacterium]